MHTGALARAHAPASKRARAHVNAHAGNADAAYTSTHWRECTQGPAGAAWRAHVPQRGHDTN